MIDKNEEIKLEMSFMLFFKVLLFIKLCKEIDVNIF